jgi:CBS domain-containing protein
MILDAETAADLMTPNPLSISADATVKEAVAFLADNGISAAPVVDASGRAVGVLSQSDVIVHDREKVEYLPANTGYEEWARVSTRPRRSVGSGFQVENVDRTRVREIMTPVIYSVPPNAPCQRVIEDMLALRVHRLFVVDRDDTLIGVISTFDILRHLRD